jgi:membrane-associated protein
MTSGLTVSAGWAYLAILLLVAADAIVPLVPSELAVVGGGVAVASGRLNVVLLIAATALGAIVGDTLGYSIGRSAGRLGVGRLLRHSSSRRVLVWATERLHRRAVPVLVTGRFIPGGRTVTTIVAGFLRVPTRRFAVAIGIGGPLWAGYVVVLGYLAGRATADRPWLGVLAAVGVLAAAGLAAEGIRRLRARSRRAQPVGSPAPVRAAAGATAPAGNRTRPPGPLPVAISPDPVSRSRTASSYVPSAQ